ncbi:odorant receptor Or2-like isoform X2 [Phymastichus coffea]|uniref:odorant receptor Or2-like isoform X2 n=1 Tax=Phymastichus coffea TaxID=108790 RepID=UPI00273B121C|nr:odorant receptor Or2-like isoform X2 [Phymastichus coffea]
MRNKAGNEFMTFFIYNRFAPFLLQFKFINVLSQKCCQFVQSVLVGFDTAFHMCGISLKLIGLWPQLKTSKLEKICTLIRFTLITSVIVVFINISQTIKLIMIWGNLDLMTDIISTANLPILIAVFKMLIFFKHRKAFEPLLEFVTSDWNSVNSKDGLKNMQANAIIARRMSWICAILGFATVHGHLLIRIGQELEYLPGKPSTRLLLVDSYFPYDYKPTPVYEVTWIMQYSGAALATFAYSGIYCLFVALVLHLCGQFANLREQLDKLVSVSNRNFEMNLAKIVLRHEQLNKFAATIENIFNPMFLAEILGCTIQFCMQGFLVVTLSSSKDMGFPVLHLLFMAVYVMHIGTHLFICCYVAEKLKDESSSIFRAVYNCKWYELQPKQAALLLIIMQRAKKPLKVTAGKFCSFSMSLYAKIFKTSAGYLSMLLAVRDRIVV